MHFVANAFYQWLKSKVLLAFDLDVKHVLRFALDADWTDILSSSQLAQNRSLKIENAGRTDFCRQFAKKLFFGDGFTGSAADVEPHRQAATNEPKNESSQKVPGLDPVSPFLCGCLGVS
jgi:hypothetical protein